MITSGPSPLMSVRETAEHLRLSVPTLYRLIRRGEIPAVRVGGQLRVDRDELDNYIYGEEQP
jgi:excisionase family DNA binding protein